MHFLFTCSEEIWSFSSDYFWNYHHWLEHKWARLVLSLFHEWKIFQLFHRKFRLWILRFFVKRRIICDQEKWWKLWEQKCTKIVGSSLLLRNFPLFYLFFHFHGECVHLFNLISELSSFLSARQIKVCGKRVREKMRRKIVQLPQLVCRYFISFSICSYKLQNFCCIWSSHIWFEYRCKDSRSILVNLGKSFVALSLYLSESRELQMQVNSFFSYCILYTSYIYLNLIEVKMQNV